jgi:hypothetical protein
VALIGQIAIAMKVETRRLKAGLAQASGMVKGFGSSLASLGMLAIGGAGGFGLYKVVKAASDVTEATNLMQVVFGNASKEILADADKMAAAFGNSKKEYLDAAGMFGGIFTQMGYGQSEAAKLSIAMVRLSDDMSSQKNITFAESLVKIKGGLTGESEALKSVGVLIDEATVKQYAYTHGIAAMNSELTLGQKVQARMGVLTSALKVAEGDHARTANEVAGAMKGLAGRTENAAAAFGQILEPIAKLVLGELNVGVQALTMAWQESGAAAISASMSSLGSTQGQAEGISYVQAAIMKMADGWYLVQGVFQVTSTIILKGLTAIIDLVGFFARGIDMVLKGLGQAETGAGQFLTETAQSMEKLSNQQWKGFQVNLQTFFEGSASRSTADYFAKARGQIEATRKDFLKQPDISGIKAPPSTMPTKANEVKFASAAAKGSQEAANAILRSRFGGGKTTDEIKKQTNLQTRMAAGIDKMAAALSRDVSMFVLENF